MTDKFVTAWIIDEEMDITINSDKWRNRAWLRMKVEDGVLAIGIIASRRYKLTNEVYGIYHGTFLATILTHFDVQMNYIEVTPMLDAKYDKYPSSVQSLL